MNRSGIVAVVAAGLVSLAGAAPAPIVFDTPAADEKGMMVLGNGEVGAMAWLDAAGSRWSAASSRRRGRAVEEM